MFNFIPMSPGNRMIRFGCGQHEGRWFLRLDLWFFGIRIVQPWLICGVLGILLFLVVN